MLRVLSKTTITVFFAILLLPIYVYWRMTKKINWSSIKRIYKLWLMK